MRESILRELETEYEAQRARNHAEEVRRLAQVTEQTPAIGALVAERMRLFRDGAQRALANPHDARDISDRLSGRIADIQSQLRAQLVKNGYDADYLQPVYHCAVCRDTGYVGDVIRERCDCLSRKLRERTANAGGHGLDPGETFEAYDEAVYDQAPLPGGKDTQRSYMERVRALCERYAQDYPGNTRRNLLLFGMSGLGKTFMLNCIGNHVRSRGEEVLKLTGYQLSQRMHAAVFERETEAFGMVIQTPLLLLDDLGVEPLYNNITIEYMFTLLNERQLAGLHTAISTNLMLDELRRRYTERICSRLFDRRHTLVVEFRGSDVRMR